MGDDQVGEEMNNEENKRALGAAAVVVDAVVSFHSEIDPEEWPAGLSSAAVRILDRAAACSQVALEGQLEGTISREPAFQAELELHSVTVARAIAALIDEETAGDEMARKIVWRIFEEALAEVEHPLLGQDLADQTMAIDGARISAWSGDAFRACRELHAAEGTPGDGEAFERADRSLRVLAIASLRAIAASMIRDGSLAEFDAPDDR